MSEDLFFIPIIAQALQQPDPASALQAAFSEIRQKGRSAEHRTGYAQFVHFMQAVIMHSQQESRISGMPESTWRLLLDLATGSFEGSSQELERALAWIRSHPAWAEQLGAMQEFVGPIDISAASPRFQVLREEREIGTILISPETGRGSLGGIAPGKYSVLLETGRLLWEAQLTPRQLTWAGAFPNQPLSLAAATGDPSCRATVSEMLLDGQWLLRVHPGLETGRIEITRSGVGI